MLTDTLNTISMSAPTQSIGLYLAIAGFGLTSIVALLQVGRIVGRHEEFKESTNAAIAELKKSENHAISREELDARFGEMKSEISAVKDRMGDIVSIVREALRK